MGRRADQQRIISYFATRKCNEKQPDVKPFLATYYKNIKYEAGCDEAGRGCLAGPVFAAAVILNPKRPIVGLDDSKKLSAERRKQLRSEIEEKAFRWHVHQCSPEVIDRINILQASLKAMYESLRGLSFRPSLVLVDGHIPIPYLEYPQQCIVKGDAQYQSIAAASILAKTYRDEYMEKLHVEFPAYQWNANKGYGTAKHIIAIEKFGLTPHHRKTFTIKNISRTLFDESED